ncbi:uncharacterized protein LOC144150167 [Haemaphysalis longicornis]
MSLLWSHVTGHVRMRLGVVLSNNKRSLWALVLVRAGRTLSSWACAWARRAEPSLPSPPRPLAVAHDTTSFWRRGWDAFLLLRRHRRRVRQNENAHLEAAGGSDWNDGRRASALVSVLGREGQRRYFAEAEQDEARRDAASNVTDAHVTSPIVTDSATDCSVTASSAPAISKFDQLLEQLDRLFAASTNTLVERHEFTSRRQFRGESFLEYVTALKEKAVRCKFGLTYAERVRDQIIHGTSNPQVREKLLAHGERLSLEKAEEIGRSFESLSLANQAFGSHQVQAVGRRGEGGVAEDDSRGSRRAQDGGVENQDGLGRRGGRRAQDGGTGIQDGLASRGGRDVIPPGSGRQDGGLQDGRFHPQSAVEFRGTVQQKFAGKLQSCERCGNKWHNSAFQNCPARNRRCNSCNKWGHFASMCRKPAPVHRVSSKEATGSASTPEPVEHPASTEINAPARSSVLTVSTSSRKDLVVQAEVSVNNPPRKDLVVQAEVSGVTMQLLVDTGASVSLMTVEDFKRHFSKQHALSKASVNLWNFSKQRIGIRGSFQAPVQVLQRSCSVTFYVTDKGTSLLGLDAIQQLGIQIDGASLTCRLASVCAVQCPVNVPPGFEHLFNGELGLVKDVSHNIQRRPGVTPVASKLRRLPLALRDPVSSELRRLEDNDVIERVDASEWVSPLVVVRKKNGDIRLCVDLREPNKAIIIDGYPLPHVEELLQMFHGAVCFSKLDLASAYHQLLLEEGSRDLTTFVTHEGLFRFKRVCFGLASAPAVFQKMMSQILKNCRNVVCYLDDILVWGKTQAEHDASLVEVLTCIANSGMKLNDKCLFSVKELDFLGHKISAEGISPLESKVKAIVHAPAPTDIKSLQSFLGLAGYYAKFIKNYAEIVEPLRLMLRKGQTFCWSDDAQRSFDQLKACLTCSPVVKVFNPDLPVVVTTDASDVGIGAVLQQRYGSRLETIAFASRTLSETERKYSVGEREALACLFACEKWHIFLWGRRFTLRTDHQAVVALLAAGDSGRRPLRISRWSARLLYYNFDIEYCKGSENLVADALSRLPIQTGQELQEEEIVSLVTSVVDKETVQLATKADVTLQKVAEYVSKGWPDKKKVHSDLTAYFHVRDELSVVDGLLMRDDRVVIPGVLVPTFLELAHENHQGIVRTKQLLRERYWWPQMDRNVEEHVKHCHVCQLADKSAKPHVAPLQPVEWPEGPWQKLGMDIVGPLDVSYPRFLVTLVDYYSKWPEVLGTNSISTEDVIKLLDSSFSREGLPEFLVTDNGPQFVSKQMQEYLKEKGIRHVFSSNYYPQANGQIERFNRVLKEHLQVARLEGKDASKSITQFLGSYRVTPHSVTGLSPAFLLHGRQPRSKVDISNFRIRKKAAESDNFLPHVRNQVFTKQHKAKQYFDRRKGAQPTRIKVGDVVKVKFRKQGFLKYSKPLTVQAQVAPFTFKLSDGKIWNASKLTVVPKGIVIGSAPYSFDNIELSSRHKEFLYSLSNLDICDSQSPSLQLSEGTSPSVQTDPDLSEVSTSARSESIVPREPLECQEENSEQTDPNSHVDNTRENEGVSGSSNNASSTSTRPRRKTKQPQWLREYVQ